MKFREPRRGDGLEVAYSGFRLTDPEFDKLIALPNVKLSSNFVVDADERKVAARRRRDGGSTTVAAAAAARRRRRQTLADCRRLQRVALDIGGRKPHDVSRRRRRVHRLHSPPHRQNISARHPPRFVQHASDRSMGRGVKSAELCVN